MKYCRYCAFCIAGDCYYCTYHNKELRRIDRVTDCKEFVISELGDVETGNPYKPHKKHIVAPQYKQITFKEVQDSER